MTAKPVPVPTPETQPFWDGCAAGELRIQRCTDCGRPYFYPRPVCPAAACADQGTGDLYLSLTSTYHGCRRSKAYLVVTAPFAGVITTRNVHPGALVGCSPAKREGIKGDCRARIPDRGSIGESSDRPAS